MFTSRHILAAALPVFLPLAAIAILATSAPTSAHAAPITRATCEQDKKDLLASIEQNRIGSLAEIDRQIKASQSQHEHDSLLALQESVWEQEEQQRGQAEFIFRDCLAAVNR